LLLITFDKIFQLHSGSQEVSGLQISGQSFEIIDQAVSLLDILILQCSPDFAGNTTIIGTRFARAEG